MKNLICFCLCFLMLPVATQADENLKKGLAKAQYMLRQANVEKVEMEKKLQEEKQAAEAKEAEIKAKEKDLAKNKKKLDKLQSTLELWQTEYEKLKKQLAATRTELALARNESEFHKTLFETQTGNFKTCERHNKELVQVGFDLLNAYEGKSVSDALKQNDPFFGLKQVEIENLVQEYRHQLEDLSLLENQYLIEQVDVDTAAVYEN